MNPPSLKIVLSIVCLLGPKICRARYGWLVKEHYHHGNIKRKQNYHLGKNNLLGASVSEQRFNGLNDLGWAFLWMRPETFSPGIWAIQASG